MSAGHTPGPWQAHSASDPLEIIGNVDGPDEGRMHYTRVCEVEDNAEAEANARLVAAAPELLAAGSELDRLTFVIESAVRRSDPLNHPAVVAAIKANRAALAKAGAA